MSRRIRLTDAAEADLKGIYSFVSERASAEIARRYIRRILDHLAGFDLFHERGTVRPDIRPGLRIVGFERRISIAFVVDETEIVVLRLLYGGRHFPQGDEA